jgi:hypothetical protein
MDKDNTNSHTDNDILQCRAEIVRASRYTKENQDTDETREVYIPKAQLPRQRTVPELDLSQRILVEQRKDSSSRRKKHTGPITRIDIPAPTGTIGAIINRSKKTMPKTLLLDQAEQITTDTKDNIPIRPKTVINLTEKADELNETQLMIISAIVSRDLARLCGEMSAA